MRYVLFVDSGCLVSSTARNAVRPYGSKVEVVYAGEADALVRMYGIKEYPTLLRIDEYGVVAKRVAGFSKRVYNELLGGR